MTLTPGQTDVTNRWGHSPDDPQLLHEFLSRGTTSLFRFPCVSPEQLQETIQQPKNRTHAGRNARKSKREDVALLGNSCRS